MSKKDDLKNIRDSIDSIDNQILSLVSERAKLAIQAGQAKKIAVNTNLQENLLF